MSKEALLFNGKNDRRILTYAPESIEHIYSAMDIHAKNTAIEFGIFLSGFKCREICGSKMWKPYNESQLFTTESLFQIFLQSKNNQQ